MPRTGQLCAEAACKASCHAPRGQGVPAHRRDDTRGAYDDATRIAAWSRRPRDALIRPHGVSQREEEGIEQCLVGRRLVGGKRGAPARTRVTLQSTPKSGARRSTGPYRAAALPDPAHLPSQCDRRRASMVRSSRGRVDADAAVAALSAASDQPAADTQAPQVAIACSPDRKQNQKNGPPEAGHFNRSLSTGC